MNWWERLLRMSDWLGQDAERAAEEHRRLMEESRRDLAESQVQRLRVIHEQHDRAVRILQMEAESQVGQVRRTGS